MDPFIIGVWEQKTQPQLRVEAVTPRVVGAESVTIGPGAGGVPGAASGLQKQVEGPAACQPSKRPVAVAREQPGAGQEAGRSGTILRLLLLLLFLLLFVRAARTRAAQMACDFCAAFSRDGAWSSLTVTQGNGNLP